MFTTGVLCPVCGVQVYLKLHYWFYLIMSFDKIKGMVAYKNMYFCFHFIDKLDHVVSFQGQKEKLHYSKLYSAKRKRAALVILYSVSRACIMILLNHDLSLCSSKKCFIFWINELVSVFFLNANHLTSDSINLSYF